MTPEFLDFEQPIAELQAKINELSNVGAQSDLNISDEISHLQKKRDALVSRIFAELSPWQIAQMARHPNRPYALDYIDGLLDEFDELHGDRSYADDPALVGGIGRIDGRPVMVLGHQKGRDVKEKVHRNFGMPRPEGYRKAQRLMAMAERFNMPVLSFIDTPGAYPGIGAEERGQSEAIAASIAQMSRLKVPVVATVTGEGGSGGALAIGVCDYLLMLQYSTYSVISPEGCASILWKTAERAPDAAAAMGITAQRLHELKLVDEILPEPLGGAHRDPKQLMAGLKERLITELDRLSAKDTETLLAERYTRLMSYGAIA